MQEDCVRALLPGGVAAVLVGAVLAVGLRDVPDTPARPMPAVAPAAATQVLDRAVLAAARMPQLNPRPDQFILYTSRGHVHDGRLRLGGPGGALPRSSRPAVVVVGRRQARRRNLVEVPDAEAVPRLAGAGSGAQRCGQDDLHGCTGLPERGWAGLGPPRLPISDIAAHRRGGGACRDQAQHGPAVADRPAGLAGSRQHARRVLPAPAQLAAVFRAASHTKGTSMRSTSTKPQPVSKALASTGPAERHHRCRVRQFRGVGQPERSQRPCPATP